jgi:hypothetical protein
MMENRFDLYDLPEGHAERFQEKLTVRLARQHRRKLVFRWTAAAAGVALIAWIALDRDTYFWRAHSPEAVYTSYLEQVGDLYRLVANNSDNDAVDWEALLHELTDENVSLYDQLPEDLPEKEKTEILKRYYGEVLDEAALIKENMNKKE